MVVFVSSQKKERIGQQKLILLSRAQEDVPPVPRRRPDQGKGNRSECGVEQEDRGDELGLGGEVEHEGVLLFALLVRVEEWESEGSDGEEGKRHKTS